MTLKGWKKEKNVYSPSKIVASSKTKVSNPPHVASMCNPLNICFVEDALENVELAEDERTKKNNELKIKRRDYTGYDDDEFTGGNEGMKRSLLSKYDEFLEGPKEQVRIHVWSQRTHFSLTCIRDSA